MKLSLIISCNVRKTLVSLRRMQLFHSRGAKSELSSRRATRLPKDQFFTFDDDDDEKVVSGAICAFTIFLLPRGLRLSYFGSCIKEKFSFISLLYSPDGRG